jgi:hypothetical protein
MEAGSRQRLNEFRSRSSLAKVKIADRAFLEDFRSVLQETTDVPVKKPGAKVTDSCAMAHDVSREDDA